MTLAELLAEAKRLDEAIAVHLPGAAKHDLCMERERLARRSFPRLVRVAEAARALRDRLASELNLEYGLQPKDIKEVAAFDAEAKGDGI